MKESTKRLLGFLSWVPLCIFTASVIYFMYQTRSLIEAKDYEAHDQLMYYLSVYYDQMFAWLFVGSVIGMSVLLAFVIHLLRIKTMNPATKALWIVFMAFTGSFALPIFYLVELRHEPEDIPMHASIA